MANFYLVAFDPHKTDSMAMHQVIKNMPTVSWWHYFGSTYIIKSNRTLQKISDEITLKWPRQRFLIVKIDPTVRNGWLQPDAWQWFRKQID